MSSRLPIWIMLVAFLVMPMAAAQIALHPEGFGEPRVVVDPQVGQGTVTVSRVVLNQSGWLVVHADEGGAPGAVVGNSALLHAGMSVGVEVPVALDADRGDLVDLHAMLHIDDGNMVYEFPGPDGPVRDAEGDIVVQPFTVRVGAAPVVTAAAPTMMLDEGVPVHLARLAQPGWIVIHLDEGGAPGAVLGTSGLLSTGLHQDLRIDVDESMFPTEANESGQLAVWSMVHVDDGDGVYEFPAADPPVVVGGTPVMTPFIVELTEPSIDVIDQTVSEDTFDRLPVARGTMGASGWIVVHPEAEGGGPDAQSILGTHYIFANDGTDIEVTLSRTLDANETLYVMLHHDDPADGRFTFLEAGDPPVIHEGAAVVEPVQVNFTGDVGGDVPGVDVPGFGVLTLFAAIAVLAVVSMRSRRR